MKIRKMWIYLMMTVLLFVGMFAACAAPETTGQSEGVKPESGAPELTGTINLVEAGGLADTVAIHVKALNTENDSDDAYTPLLSIEDAPEVAAIIDSLDVQLGFQPENLCIADYIIDFELADGSLQEFEYGCGDTYWLRGQQAYLPHPVIAPSPEFVDLIGSHIEAAISEPAPETINPVAAYGLANTVSIEILKHTIIDHEDGTLSANFESVVLIEDSQQVDALVRALDTPLKTGPLVRCPPSHAIIFRLRDGVTVSFSAYCQETPEMLQHEDDSYLVLVSDSFSALLHDLLSDSNRN